MSLVRRCEFAISKTKGTIKLWIDFKKNQLVSDGCVYLTMRNYRRDDTHLTNSELNTLLKFTMFEYLDMRITNLGAILDCMSYQSKIEKKVKIEKYTELPESVDTFEFCVHLKNTLFRETKDVELCRLNFNISKVIFEVNENLRIYHAFFKNYNRDIATEFIVRHLAPSVYDIYLVASLLVNIVYAA